MTIAWTTEMLNRGQAQQWNLYLPKQNLTHESLSKNTFLLHLEILFHNHVLLWPNGHLLSSFLRGCVKVLEGRAYPIPKRFHKIHVIILAFTKEHVFAKNHFQMRPETKPITATLFNIILQSSGLHINYISIASTSAYQTPYQAVSQWYFSK